MFGLETMDGASCGTRKTTVLSSKHVYPGDEANCAGCSPNQGQDWVVKNLEIGLEQLITEYAIKNS